MDVASLGLSAIFVLGLSFGAGPCSITCLPFLGPVFLANNRHNSAWKVLLPFSSGRLCGYTLLGAGAAYLGSWIENWMESDWPGIILGYATLLLALTLLIKPQKNKTCHAAKTTADTQTITFKKRHTPFQGSLFFVGLGMAINPCAPLAMVISAAAATGNVETGMLLGVCFGLGAVILPTLIFAYGVAHMGSTIRQALNHWQPHLETASIMMLIFMGSATAMGWITL